MLEFLSFDNLKEYIKFSSNLVFVNHLCAQIDLTCFLKDWQAERGWRGRMSDYSHICTVIFKDIILSLQNYLQREKDSCNFTLFSVYLLTSYLFVSFISYLFAIGLEIWASEIRSWT